MLLKVGTNGESCSTVNENETPEPIREFSPSHNVYSPYPTHDNSNADSFNPSSPVYDTTAETRLEGVARDLRFTLCKYNASCK